MRLLWTLVGARQLPARSRRKLGVVALLYFVEGSPVSVLWEVLPVYLRVEGLSLRAIGGLRLLELPFSLKVLWSPLVQRFGDRRWWVAAAMLTVALVTALLPLATSHAWWLLLLLLLVLTTASATQDMAIDSYTVALVDREEQGAANGIRASAYRVALVVLGSGMVTLATWLPWPALYAAAAIVFLGLGVIVLAAVPRLDVPAEARQRWLAPFLAWIGTWKAVPLVLFVLTYKLGEFAIGPMVKPFWVDQGRELWEIGLVPTALGIVLSIAGSLTGGAFISRHGAFTSLWALGLPQAVSNLGYAAVAGLGLPWPALYLASMVDSFSAGLGTAAFLAFFLAVCDPERATLQYAFLSSLFSLTGRFAGAVSGLGAEHWGYATYFAITFFASLPALALLPWIAPWMRERAPVGSADDA